MNWTVVCCPQCCLASVVLACLHQDQVLLTPRLEGDRLTAPTILASCLVLVVSTVLRSRLWLFPSRLAALGGAAEVLLALITLPLFVAVWGSLWLGVVVSEPMVVFLTPYPLVLLLCATTYSAWLLALAALVSGLWMMSYRLPMIPYSSEEDFDDDVR